jgi:hypothetical protein
VKRKVTVGFDGVAGAVYNESPYGLLKTKPELSGQVLCEREARRLWGEERDVVAYAGSGRNQRVVTGCMAEAARLFRLLVEMVRSRIDPQLMHFQA